MFSDEELYNQQGCIKVKIAVSNLCLLGASASVQQLVLDEAKWHSTLTEGAAQGQDTSEGGQLLAAALDSLMEHDSPAVGDHLWVVAALGALQSATGQDYTHLLTLWCQQLQQQGSCETAAQNAINHAEQKQGCWPSGLHSSLCHLVQCQPAAAATELAHKLLSDHCTLPVVATHSPELLYALCSAVCASGVSVEAISSLAAQFVSSGDCKLLQSVLCCWKATFATPNSTADYSAAIRQCVGKLLKELPIQSSNQLLVVTGTELLRLALVQMPSTLSESQLQSCEQLALRGICGGAVTGSPC